MIEAAITEKVAKQIYILGRQIAFQRGLSSAITLTNVDATLRTGNNTVGTLDLTKAYDRANSPILLADCASVLDKEIVKMIAPFIQVLTVSTKREVFGKEAY